MRNISKKLHPYKQFDYYTEHTFNVYQKYIETQKGGDILGNDYYHYDFEILENQIFLGRRDTCARVLIENKSADIIFFGYQPYCSKDKTLDKNLGTKHMFLWLLICILKYFDVDKIGLGDRTEIECDDKHYPLSKYYFLKYGKQYYEYYFDFHIEFIDKYQEKSYKNFLNKRKTLILDINFIIDIIKEFGNQKELYIFIELFEGEKMLMRKYLKKIPNKIKYHYCHFYFYMIDVIYRIYFKEPLPNSFFMNIKDRKKFILRIKNYIQKYFLS